MPTREQIRQLGAAAQDILDGRDFNAIQADIEPIGATGADAWFAARLCKTPTAAPNLIYQTPCLHLTGCFLL